MGDSPEYPGGVLNNSKAIEITGKIMVIAIIVLFVVIVVVLFLHLYARWFWWRVMEEEPPLRERNRSLRRRRRRFVFVPSQDNVARTRRGLDPSVLHSIPIMVYRPEDFKEGLECAVCLCDVAEDEKTRILPKCNHGFHVECIDMWFQSQSTCPLCRNPVNSDYNGSSNAAWGESEGSEGISETRSDVEASRLPVNVLFWGDETRVSSRIGAMGGTNHEEPPRFSHESEGIRPGLEEALVIEIPRRVIEDMEPSLSPSTSGCPPDELKSPVTGRLRSLRRLVSWERRVSPCSPNGVSAAAAAAIDIEQGGRNTSRPS